MKKPTIKVLAEDTPRCPVKKGHVVEGKNLGALWGLSSKGTNPIMVAQFS